MRAGPLADLGVPGTPLADVVALGRTLAIARARCDLPHPIHALWQSVLGGPGVRGIPIADGALTLQDTLDVAGALADIGDLAQSARWLLTLDPAAAVREPGLALRVLPELPRSELPAHAAWLDGWLHSAAAASVDLAERAVLALLRSGHIGLGLAHRGALLPDAGALLDATLALWRGQWPAAIATLERHQVRPRLSAQAAAVVTIARARAHPCASSVAALQHLRAAHAHDPHLADPVGRAAVWTAMQCGDDGLLDATRRTAPDHPALCLLGRIAQLRAPPGPRRDVDAGLHLGVLQDLARAGIGPDTAARQLDEAALWELLAGFGGNLTDAPTWTDGVALRPLELTTARQQARQLQARLPVDGLDAVLAAFAGMQRSHPEASAFATYGAEVLLWAGRASEAALVCGQVWGVTENRWAYVGLGAARAALGDANGARVAWRDGSARHGGRLAGEATACYAADLALAAGDLETAHVEAEFALRGRGTRLRAWLVWAEVQASHGADDRGRAGLLQAFALAPGLFLDDLWPRFEPVLEGTLPALAIADLCRIARTRCAGNASSWLYSWRDGDGGLRAWAHVPFRHIVGCAGWLSRSRYSRGVHAHSSASPRASPAVAPAAVDAS
ncbi:MAG: hypothetical protein EXR79_12365 [Myxococcales bacterium]|nr:hypothetical protein [Myxococcales bacterium]